MTGDVPGPFRVRTPRLRSRLLGFAEAAIFVGAGTALAAVTSVGALPLTVFLVVGQPLLVLGMAAYGVVAIAEILSRRGVSHMHFEVGDVIFRQGEPGDRMYTIIAGEVEVLREEPGTPPVTIARLGKGEFFGEMALVSDAPRLATVRATTPLELAAMTRGDFSALYAYLPGFHRMIESLVERRTIDNLQR